MIGYPTLSGELTKSFVSLWTRYAGKPPTDARTEIRGNVVTCVLADAVGDFNQSMIAQTRDTVRGVGRLTAAAYKREAVAAVVGNHTPARRLVREQPRPRHGRGHRDVHLRAIRRPRSAAR
jgi:hypothetical protein